MSRASYRTSLSWSRVVLLGCALLTLIVAMMVTSGEQAGAASPKKIFKRLDPGSVLGIASNATTPVAGIRWVKVGYPTCGAGNLSGAALQSAVQGYHSKGINVLLIYCQPQAAQLFNTTLLHVAAQAGADAVQCGNEQMKSGKYNNYVSPSNFAKFFDLCQGAMRAVNAGIPIVLGSLDPHVAGNDYNLMMGQVYYLDAMQAAMNSHVHPRGNWTWRSQILGVINSWHDGFPSAATNNLYGLFAFWANQFHVSLSSGVLGQHLWVVEDTGCFKGCDNAINSRAKIAIAHIMALIVDAQTATRYRVPFFFFSAKDFLSQGIYWPIGVQDINGHAKPLRQDLSMGSRSLTLACGYGHVTVYDQVKLLSSLYSGCSLPNGWVNRLV